MRVYAGSRDELEARGCTMMKAGARPICVAVSGGEVYAVDDRCPHLGFPLHRGTVDDGLLTCHWHHARFDLASGGTLDPFADDVHAHTVEVEGDDVYVVVGDEPATTSAMLTRLREGLDQGIRLVVAKAVARLAEAGADPARAVRVGLDFGLANRAEGWGAGLTALVAVANLLPQLDEADRAAALVHGLAHVIADTRGHAPAVDLGPLEGSTASADRLGRWYRRSIETRDADAAERVLSTFAVRGDAGDVERVVFAAVTDHVFIDVGHTLDFTNKAVEALAYLDADTGRAALTSLVEQTAAARRHEEDAAWRSPVDLPALIGEEVSAVEPGQGLHDDAALAEIAWRLLGDDPIDVLHAVTDAAKRGASVAELARTVAYAAALRGARFHRQNDHADWNSVHHTFTHANALHRAARRNPVPETMRGVYHVAARLWLTRFLNVPPARLPDIDLGDLGDLADVWDVQGDIDRAGRTVAGHLRAGGDLDAVIAVLGHALCREDASFHMIQHIEAAATQARAWPRGAEPQWLIMTAAARFLAAHTPTRRQLPHTIDTATRLIRGDDLFAEA